MLNPSISSAVVIIFVSTSLASSSVMLAVISKSFSSASGEPPLFPMADFKRSLILSLRNCLSALPVISWN
jgi:hypothetical protein